MLASILILAPTRRPEVNTQACPEICHVFLNRIEGTGMFKATSPDPSIDATEDNKVSLSMGLPSDMLSHVPQSRKSYKCSDDHAPQSHGLDDERVLTPEGL